MNTVEFMVPSKKLITIRENTGDDEGLLSSIANSMDGSNVRNYLANIVEKGLTGKKQLADEFNGWKVNNYYYVLMVQRVFNLGHEFSFDFTCPNPTCNHTANYTEDLREWIEDDFTSENTKKKAPAPYVTGEDHQIDFTLKSSKKTLRFDILTVALERALDAIPLANRNVNTPLIQRNLSLHTERGWEKVTFFRDFNSRDMAEIRAYLNKYDRQWQPLTDIVCEKCQTKHSENLLFLPGFYYPEAKI